MEDRLSINSEIVTAAADGTLSGHSSATDHAEETLPSGRDAHLPQAKRGVFASIRRGAKAYGAALVATAAHVPIIASALTAGFYFAPPFALFPGSLSGWHPIIYGSLVAYTLWLIASAFFYPFTTVRGVNNRSYGTLITDLNQLKSQLDVIEAHNHDKSVPVYQRVALREAWDWYNVITRNLRESPSGLQWVLGTGYMNVWSMLHRIEEAMVEVEPIEMVIRGALHDKLAIQDSKMVNRLELLLKLRRAVICLDPAMDTHFRRDKQDEGDLEIRQLKQQLKRVAAKVGIELDDDRSIGSDTSQLMHDTDQESMARATIREIKRTLNVFRDSLWESLVRARNHLMATIFVTGLVTYLLLCIAILSTGPLINGNISDSPMLAAVMFYIIGTIAGLFGRIRRESTTSQATDDFGLSTARLIATPLLSGLAAVGGVLIYGTLLFTTEITSGKNGSGVPLTQNVFSLTQNVFNLNQPEFLLIAAIFGLAPSLITRSLQKRTEQYFSALNTSKGAEVDLSDDGN